MKTSLHGFVKQNVATDRECKDMKRSLHELAIFGADPLFGEPLRVGRPNVGNQERLLERITDVLKRR